MFKILFIAGLIALLLFFIVRRLGVFDKSRDATPYLSKSEWLEITLDNRTLRKVVKHTVTTVGIGFVLLIIILLITAKFRLALIMLPISLYLIGQYFVLMNQIKIYRNQRVLYNLLTHDCSVRGQDGVDYVFNLDEQVLDVRTVKAIQKNNGLLFGFYVLKIADRQIIIPFVLNQNLNNRSFFAKLDSITKNGVSKLFPIH